MPVANLVYASTRRSDVPQLSAFRDLIQKNYKLKEGFLKFPDNTYARGTKITPEVYTALQLAHPNDKQIQILFDHICLKHGAIYWKGFSSGLMHQLGQIEKNLYR
ncbi:hypothetical protein P8452_67262 [Trifolium repens]|nr:hypothetical protein P8452_67262 [Trifolium repens]